jgi:hypothetical protein
MLEQLGLHETYHKISPEILFELKLFSFLGDGGLAEV